MSKIMYYLDALPIFEIVHDGKMLLCRDTIVEGVSGQEGAEPPGRTSGGGKRGRGWSGKKVGKNS